MTDPERTVRAGLPDSAIVDTAIRLGVLALLGYWSFKVIGPFLTVGLWSAILTVAVYPLYERLARLLGGRRRLAAVVVTLLSLVVVIGPVTFFGFGMVGGIDIAMRGLDAPLFAMPMPHESVKGWPLIGERIYDLWALAATSTAAALTEVGPSLKPLASRLLGIAGSVGLGLLEFVAAILIAGFLYSPGPQLGRSLEAVLRRIFGNRSGEMLTIAGETIRNVSRGVVGVSLVQAVFAALGFIAAGVPAAGFFGLLALILGIVQIGPTILIIPIIIWAWTAMDTVGALIFTAYMIPVSLIDNILRPVVMARGLATPMPVIFIGVTGGTIAYGISGLFLGPIVLSVAWALLVAWVQADAPATRYPE